MLPLSLIVTSCAPFTAWAFAPLFPPTRVPLVLPRTTGSHHGPTRIFPIERGLARLATTNTGDDAFDPFGQSPHSFGSDDSANGDNDGATISNKGSNTFATLNNLDNNNSDSTTNNNNYQEIEEFDPLLSPHAYANGADAAPVDEATAAAAISQGGGRDWSSGSFGFDIGAMEHQSSEPSISSLSGNDDELEFDPLLSPHAYANGVDAGPVSDEDAAEALLQGGNSNVDGSSSTFGFPIGASYELLSDASEEVTSGDSADEEEFDPLLSPHAYANGVDAGPVENSVENSVINVPDENETSEAATDEPAPAKSATVSKTTNRLGILLIDHGSKRPASNAHIHNVAKMYEARLNQKNIQAYFQKDNNANNKVGESDAAAGGTGRSSATITIVRAAHMELNEPSILTSLRQLLTMDKVDRVVCVPYFLSPGRHATEDVPRLIDEARVILREENVLPSTSNADSDHEEEDDDDTILSSSAIGTHLESMLGAVDDLVEWTLMKKNNMGDVA